jgi:hypothetical protein
MEYVIAALAVWWVWLAVLPWITAPEWFWTILITVLGIGAALLIDPSTAYWGLGIAGGSLLVKRVEELLLLVADRVRVDVLRNTRR